MKTEKRLFILVSALPLLIFGGFKASAQQVTDDLGTWCAFQFVKAWEKPMVTARIEHRSCDMVSATEAWFVMAGAGYSFTKWLTLDGGYEFWRIPSADCTLHKAVLGLTGTLRREGLSVALREKYELAFNQAGGKPTSTLRSRIRAQYAPAKFPMRPYVMAEFFNGFGATSGWIRSLHYVGTDIVADRHNIFDVYYMYHLFPNGAGEVCSRHILGVTYTLAF